jgi:hypothetical protein
MPRNPVMFIWENPPGRTGCRRGCRICGSGAAIGLAGLSRLKIYVPAAWMDTIRFDARYGSTPPVLMLLVDW